MTRLLPREHGTWAMLLAPWLVGVGVAGRVDGAAGLLAIAAVAFFLAHHHLMEWWRARSRTSSGAAEGHGRLAIGFTTLGALAAAPLLGGERLVPLLVVGGAGAVATVLSLWLIDRRLDHGVPGQLLAAIALPLTAPAAYVTATAQLDRRALGLWLVNAIFYLWSVIYVGLKISARARRAPLASPSARLAFAARTLAGHVPLAALAVAAAYAGRFSPAVLLAFVPALAQTIVGVARLHRPAVLKRVGVLLVVHSLVFVALVVAFA